jgi:predicted acetyltransferase
MDFTYPIRPITEAELPAFSAVGDQAFNSSWPAEQILELDRLVFEYDRSLAAFDGDLIVGSAMTYSFTMTVPGGSVRTGGVSFVAVLPTHRRRGILSALMRRELADIADAGEPVAALFASEATIYGRFGYGPATEQHDFTVHRGEGMVRPHPVQGPALTLRLADPAESVKEMKAVYDAVLPARPGMLHRRDAWWDLMTRDPESLRDGRSPRRCLVAQDESGPRGYAMYSAKSGWGSDGLPSHTLYLRELFYADLPACRALWSDLLSRDLVSQVHVRQRAVDDPLPRLLADARRARPEISDGLWIRLVDLPAALTQRRYASGVDIVIEVDDDLLPANSGRWRLTAGQAGQAGQSGHPGQSWHADDPAPACERTTAPADVRMPIAALGAAYLGGVRLGSLAAVGQITEHTPGALARLSAAMWWDPAPWAPTTF